MEVFLRPDLHSKAPATSREEPLDPVFCGSPTEVAAYLGPRMAQRTHTLTLVAAERRGAVRPDLRATAILTIAPRMLPELQLLCERWDLTIEMRDSVAVIGGPARVVDGLVAVTGMYRR
jgi:hypothetical protein